MPDATKTFSYTEDGLSYTVTIYEQDGQFLADITVDEGAMDVNAVYFGDDDYSGDSESLDGPLNMNGGGSQLDGESVQWDDAVALSSPGLGTEGTDKDTYLQQGDTLTVELDIDSLDEIDIFGIRATSTTTEEGSIKGVSGEEPEEPTYDKVFFGDFDDQNDNPDSGFFATEADLPEDQEPTFANYLSYYESFDYNDVTQIEGVAFYQQDEEGNTQEVLRIEAPEGGFKDSAELLDAYDAALEEMDDDDAEAFAGADLISALSLPEDSEETDEPEEVEDDAEAELA